MMIISNQTAREVRTTHETDPETFGKENMRLETRIRV